MVGIDDIAIAVATLLVSIIAGESQQRGAEQRNAREIEVRKYYQAVEDRWGITIDQLNQAAAKLDLNLSQLKDATRGSARLSQASKICREYVQEYPDRVKAINTAKTDIQNAVNNLKAKENQRASQIQRRENVSNRDILEDIYSQSGSVNSAVGNVNSALKDGDKSSGTINTGLTDASQSSQPTRYRIKIYKRGQKVFTKHIEDPNGNYVKNENGNFVGYEYWQLHHNSENNNNINTSLSNEEAKKEGN